MTYTYPIAGRNLTVAEIAELCPGVPVDTLKRRLNKGERNLIRLQRTKAETLHISKSRFCGWQIQPRRYVAGGWG